MKTLIFYGSARKRGRTREMLDLFLSRLEGEAEVIEAYRTPVSPCLDCRSCMGRPGCAVKDGMTGIYQKIEQADHLLFLSPVYFFGLPGPMKTMLDRLQCYWGAYYRGDDPFGGRSRRAGILLAGGAPPLPDQFTAALLELRAAAQHCGCTVAAEITMDNADAVGVDGRADVAQAICRLARQFSQTQPPLMDPGPGPGQT